MKTNILYLNKSAYENGKISGEYFKERVNIDVEYINNVLSDDTIKNKIVYQFDRLKKEYPNYYEETIGKADGLGIDKLTYFAIMCPEITDINFEHCTTIMCRKDNGNFIISHNEDDDYIEGNFCLSKVRIDNDNWFVTNDMYNMPFGNGISWNSYGIVKTINYCHDDNINLDNYSRYYLQRHISEAKSINDLISRCKEMKVASGFHVNAIDINNNIAVSIEVYSDGIDVEYIEDYYIHSNHFIHKNHIENQKTDNGSNSIFRLNKAKELLQYTNRDINNIKNILSYRSKEDKFDNSILQTKNDPYITLFNFSFDTDDKNIIYLNSYTNNEKLELQYNL